MLHPSYSELIQAINNNAEEDDNTMMLNSRYSLVLQPAREQDSLLQVQNRSYQTQLTRSLFLLLSTNFTKVKLKS